MTARGLIAVFLRRWYVIALGAVLTVAGMYVTLHQPGVYWTQMTVVLLAPAEEYFPNKIQDPHYALAPMAGVIVKEWNKDHSPTLTASGDTTLFGEGKVDEVQVRMPNQGSQWRPLYLTPNIDVQVVGTDPVQVEEQAIKASAELAAILDEQQDQIGVSARLRISSVASPEVPTVYFITGSRPRALAATALAGALSTFALTYWLDRYLRGRRSRLQPSGSAADELDQIENPPTVTATW